MDTGFLIFLLVGKLFIYLGMKFPPLSESRIDFIRRLFSCSECLGVWCYTILSFILGEHLFGDIFYVPFLSELATGGIVAIFVHLVDIGWREKFTILEIV